MNDWKILLGNILGTGQKLKVAWDQLVVHTLILGGSGSGKSKMLEWIMRQLMLLKIGFLFIDPHGDTAKNLGAFAVAQKSAHNDDEMWRRTHYLTVGPELAFALDPFAHLPKRREVSEAKYYARLDTAVQLTARAILRRFGNAEFEMMNRMLRWMENMLYFCGTSFDDNNTHHGLDKMLIALNPQHYDFEGLFGQVAPFLPDYVLHDYLRLIATKRPQDQERWTESCFNNLRRLCNFILQAVFSQRASSISMKGFVRESAHVIADLSQTGETGKMQSFMLGGLLIQDLIGVKFAESDIPPSQRKPFVLIIDELGQFLGEDLKDVAEGGRKFNLPIIGAAQNLATLIKGDLDLAPTFLGIFQTIATFQQTYRPDKEILADRIATGDIDSTRLMVEVQRQRGWQERTSLDVSYSATDGNSWSEGEKTSQSVGTNESIRKMESLAKGYSEALANSHTTNTTKTEGEAEGGSRGKTTDKQLVLRDEQVQRRIPKESNSEVATHQKTETNATGEANGTVHTKTEQKSVTNALTLGEGSSRSQESGHTSQNGGSTAFGRTISIRKTLLPHIVSQMEWQGLYVNGTAAEQYEKVMQTIHCLSVAEALVSVRGLRNSFHIKVPTVREWYDEDGKWLAVKALIAQLKKIRPYYFNPSELPPAIAAAKPLLIAAEALLIEAPANRLTVVESNGHALKKGHAKEANGHVNGKPPPKNPFGR